MSVNLINQNLPINTLKDEWISAIKAIKADNKTLSSKGTRHTTSLSLLGTIALIAGIALAIIGSILCATGAGLPVGAILLSGGIPLTIGSLFVLYKTGNKIDLRKQIEKNKEKIRKIKLLQDPLLLKFVRNLRIELGADFLTTAEFSTKANMIQLQKLHNQYKTESITYNSKFDLMWAQINLANSLLQELNEKVGQAEGTLKKAPNHPNKIHFEQEIENCLDHALKVKRARARIFKDRPGAAKMANSGFARMEAIEKIAYKAFANLDPD